MSGEKPLAVTGGTGFVGQALLDLTDERCLLVNALTRKPRQDKHSRVEWITGDLDNMPALEHLMAGANAVIHIAGLTNTPDPSEFHHANVTGTANVIAAMKHMSVKRLVFVSSLSARKPDLSLYGASKAAAEELVRASGLEWTIVRPPAVYGPRDVDMFELFRSAKFGFVPLPPGGATSIIHVRDLARALLDLVDAQPALVRKKQFEVDDGREGGWSHKELAQAIGEAMNRPVFAPHLPASVLQAAARVDRLLRGSNAKLTEDRVGYMCHPNWVSYSALKVPEAVWQPEIGGEAGLKQTAEWYRKQGWL
ncbi:NAD-dependent epimerase/dehydratase family protein [Altererythrobacter sp. GH1-8]|uniref:NAD-dependent epimerase/dehydratase family protein n=1 Tax=Altererythrobacter sp. GH1-8 TaxID=3349333 RepID=UPI00374CED4D